jgi:predicted neuraminidase
MLKLVTLTGLVLLAINIWQVVQKQSDAWFLINNEQSNSTGPAQQETPFFYSDYASHASTPEVHSATAIELKDNHVMAFWYGGTNEGHKDVRLFQNTWNSKTRRWGQEKAIINRSLTRDNVHRYIRKLGNPVVTRGPDQSLWLFYVSVSVGGWAGSSINLIRSYDEGQSWTASKRLITSPFLNLSTLIKGMPVHYSDKTIGLPVYHEFIGKFGELLRINEQGDVITKTRLSWGKTSLQPIILVTSPDTAVAMMRYHGEPPHRILSQFSDNAGRSWSKPVKSELPNPDAGIIGIPLQKENSLLLAFNNDEEEREDMSLAMSTDQIIANQGKHWDIVKEVEANRLKVPDKKKQFSYPWLLQTTDGTIHLLYTWHKSHIKHVYFNTQWLQQSVVPTNKLINNE